ncbi:hypothetical protein RUND412_005157 [Rhizina undulata]
MTSLSHIPRLLRSSAIPTPHLHRHLATWSSPPTPAKLLSLSSSPVPYQIYISATNNPHHNLSLEHYLFKRSPPTTITLFIYTNRPSIILGRNQNPWLEVNIPLLTTASSSSSPISILRRRSGGGTVFHDLGNVNYSVMMPTKSFDRDKHAEMVVRALRTQGITGATVNDRHDIVLLPHVAEGTKTPGATPHGTVKISGSAYKLERLRSYHHGTMLLSAQLGNISKYLKSPARSFIKAKGVESVRSPVGNVNIPAELFIAAVAGEFARTYQGDTYDLSIFSRLLSGSEVLQEDRGEIDVCVAGEETLRIPEIATELNELASPTWLYGQTPQCTLTADLPTPASNSFLPPTAECDPDAPPPTEGYTRCAISANKGVITASTIFPQMLEGKKFDGGVINDVLAATGNEKLGQWFEDSLGRTEWVSVEEH